MCQPTLIKKRLQYVANTAFKITVDWIYCTFTAHFKTAFFCSLVRAVATPTNSILVSGQQLDFEPVREHEPPRGEANKKGGKKEGIVSTDEPVTLHRQLRLWDGS